MKTLVCAAALLLTAPADVMAATARASSGVHVDAQRSREPFDGHLGTFVLLDARTGVTERLNAADAPRRLSPCSTFKIPNALIALETGVASGPEHLIRWDGTRRAVSEWNRDHTLRSAIQYSTVWYFQRIAAGVGESRMRHWLHRLAYGNEDTSGGLTTFWLKSSLAISADEQVAFLRRLVDGTLPASERSQRLVREMLRLRETERGVLHGKTGSGRRDGSPDLGWFVGWVDTPGGARVFALHIEGPGATGAKAREIAERILTDRGLL